MRVFAFLPVLLLAAGCASFSPDGGLDFVKAAAKRETGQDVVRWASPGEGDAVSERVAALLKGPISAEGAVQVALLNNRDLQSILQDLALAEADLVQAGRLPNPHIAIARSKVGGDVTFEQALGFNVMSLLTMPLATEIEKRRFAGMQRQVAVEVIRLASETRKAWFQAVAAEETVRYLRMVRTSAEAGAELARRMARVGNWSALSQAREQSFYADAALQLARAERSSLAARERLVRLMGMSAAGAVTLPERLPDLPGQADDLPDVEQRAMGSRVDLQIARLDAEAQARSLGLARATRFVNVVDLEGRREHEHFGGAEGSSTTKRTWEISFELPLFDFGTARVARAEALYMRSVHRAAGLVAAARSEVREAHAGYRAAYDIARFHRDEIVPLRKKIGEENLLRYNGMLIGVFELLADARAQVSSVNASIEALRDFWLAKADLDMALVGRPTPSIPEGATMGATATAAGGH